MFDYLANSNTPTSEDVFRERLWASYNLSSFYLLGKGTAPGPIAEGWSDINGNGQKDNVNHLIEYWESPSLRWAAGSLVATPKDMLKWVDLLYAGNVISSGSLTQKTSFVPVNVVIGRAMDWEHNVFLLTGKFNRAILEGYRDIVPL